jgi:hypothetical protein
LSLTLINPREGKKKKLKIDFSTWGFGTNNERLETNDSNTSFSFR